MRFLDFLISANSPSEQHLLIFILRVVCLWEVTNHAGRTPLFLGVQQRQAASKYQDFSGGTRTWKQTAIVAQGLPSLRFGFAFGVRILLGVVKMLPLC